MVRSFYSSQYTESLTILDKIRIDCMLDIHLYEKVGTLCEMIRQRALVQYTLPYISIDLGKMATAFSVSTTKLERELADLIMSNKISARIDSKEKVSSGLQGRRQRTPAHSSFLGSFAFTLCLGMKWRSFGRYNARPVLYAMNRSCTQGTQTNAS